MDNLVKFEHKGQRVLTTQQLAERYETEPIQLQQNFLNNKSHYQIGTHYFLLEGQELREFKRDLENFEVAQNVNKIYLWTEKGCLLHAKSLGTDKAWQVYEMLVDTYFRVKELQTKDSYSIDDPIERAERWIEERKERNLLESKVVELEPKADFYDTVHEAEGCHSVGEVAKLLGTGRTRLFDYLKSKNVLCNDNTPRQQYKDLNYFRVIENPFKSGEVDVVNTQTLVTGKGLIWLKKFIDGDPNADQILKRRKTA